MCTHKYGKQSLYIKKPPKPCGLISSLKDIGSLFATWWLIFWFSCHSFPFLSLSERYTWKLNDVTSVKKLSFEGSKVSFLSCIWFRSRLLSLMLRRLSLLVQLDLAGINTLPVPTHQNNLRLCWILNYNLHGTIKWTVFKSTCVKYRSILRDADFFEKAEFL